MFMKLLGHQATPEEVRVLCAFQYVYRFYAQNPKAWSALNFIENTNDKVCLTYCLNELQLFGLKSIQCCWLVLFSISHNSSISHNRFFLKISCEPRKWSKD